MTHGPDRVEIKNDRPPPRKEPEAEEEAPAAREDGMRADGAFAGTSTGDRAGLGFAAEQAAAAEEAAASDPWAAVLARQKKALADYERQKQGW